MTGSCDSLFLDVVEKVSPRPHQPQTRLSLLLFENFLLIWGLGPAAKILSPVISIRPRDLPFFHFSSGYSNSQFFEIGFRSSLRPLHRFRHAPLTVQNPFHNTVRKQYPNYSFPIFLFEQDLFLFFFFFCWGLVWRGSFFPFRLISFLVIEHLLQNLLSPPLYPPFPDRCFPTHPSRKRMFFTHVTPRCFLFLTWFFPSLPPAGNDTLEIPLQLRFLPSPFWSINQSVVFPRTFLPFAFGCLSPPLHLWYRFHTNLPEYRFPFFFCFSITFPWSCPSPRGPMRSDFFFSLSQPFFFKN